MDPHAMDEKNAVPVAQHDKFTECYYLQVIDLYREQVSNGVVHRGICEIASDRMRRQAVFKEDIEYCFETCMAIGVAEDPPF